MPKRKRTTALTIRELRPGDRVFVYLRDSGGAGQERSVDEQRAAVERYAAARGWIIADYYIDEAAQSGNYGRRTDFAALLDACRRQPPPVDGVLTYSFARFGRDEYDSQFYRLELRRNGVQVDSVIDDVPAGPMAAVIEAVIDTQNRLFLDNMARHVREGLLKNVQAGCAPGGTPPTGLRAVRVEIGTRRDGSKRMAPRWEHDPDMAPRVAAAFRLAAEGLPYAAILEQTGLRVAPGTLRSMLGNRSYLGLIKLGAEEYPAPWAPLVDRATWDAVQARFVTRAEQARKARRMSTTTFVLSGLAACGHCGALLDGDSDRRPTPGGKPRVWRAYRCRACDELGRINAAQLEPGVIGAVLDHLLTPERMGEVLERVRAALNDPGVAEELARLGQEIGAKRRSIGALVDAVEQGAGPSVYGRLREREGELAQLEERRRQLEERLRLAGAPFGEEDLAQVIARMRAQVTDEDGAVVRHALRQYVERVLVWRGEFEVFFRGVDLRPVVQGYSDMPPRGFTMLPAVSWRIPIAFVRRI